MNELMIFGSEDFGEIRMVEVEDKIYIVGKDVARALGYSNPRDAISRHCKGVVKHDSFKEGGHSIALLPEGDVYRLIVGSNMPKAVEFEFWVFDEVLPSVRQKGHYIANSEQARNNAIAEGISQITSPATIKLVQMLLDGQTELIEKNTLLETKIKEDEPLVNYANRVLKSSDCVLVRDVAKILSDEGLKIGERKLYNKLRDWGMIFKHSTEPMQLYIDRGLFVVEQYSISTVYGVKLQNVTKVTPKGQIHIAEKFLKEIY